MNCVDITLLCVFKKSLSNIYVAFFFKRLECVSASGRTHITLLSHLRNRPKTDAFAVTNRNKKTINYKFNMAKSFHQRFCSAYSKPCRRFCNFCLRAFFTSFQIIRENILPSENQKKNTVQKTPSTIRRKIPILFGCFAKFFTPCLHLISP